MKRLKEISEESFLKLFFFCFSASFFLAIPFLPDREHLLSGLWDIVRAPCKSQTSYFAVGGYAATFLNMGLIGLVCTGLYCLPGKKPSSAYTLAIILTIGFGSWGINLLNMLSTFLGVVIFF